MCFPAAVLQIKDIVNTDRKVLTLYIAVGIKIGDIAQRGRETALLGETAEQIAVRGCFPCVPCVTWHIGEIGFIDKGILGGQTLENGSRFCTGYRIFRTEIAVRVSHQQKTGLAVLDSITVHRTVHRSRARPLADRRGKGKPRGRLGCYRRGVRERD